MSGADLRIVHLASLARSGETMLLRTLSAHPQVHVVHDLHDHNTELETRLFRLLRVWPGDTLPRWQLDAHLAPRALAAAKTVLLIKQGVFAPRHRFAGFGLVRNPYAAFCSLWSYDARGAGHEPSTALNERYWISHRLPRLQAWAQSTMPWLLPTLRAERRPVAQFLSFWRARITQITEACPCVVRYEDFVRSPAAQLQSVCAAIGLPFDNAMAVAHERYQPGQRGHGGIDLGAPIHASKAWAPDPLVELAPFVEAVQSVPYAGYRRIYDAAQAEPRAAALTA